MRTVSMVQDTNDCALEDTRIRQVSVYVPCRTGQLSSRTLAPAYAQNPGPWQGSGGAALARSGD